MSARLDPDTERVVGFGGAAIAFPAKVADLRELSDGTLRVLLEDGTTWTLAQSAGAPPAATPADHENPLYTIPWGTFKATDHLVFTGAPAVGLASQPPEANGATRLLAGLAERAGLAATAVEWSQVLTRDDDTTYAEGRVLVADRYVRIGAIGKAHPDVLMIPERLFIDGKEVPLPGAVEPEADRDRIVAYEVDVTYTVHGQRAAELRRQMGPPEPEADTPAIVAGR